MEEPRSPTPIGPSMRKVLDEIAASKRERDTAAAQLPMGQASGGLADRAHGTIQDEALIACWQRQHELLQALLQESAKQTRLLGEILARLPTGSPPVSASEVRRDSK